MPSITILHISDLHWTDAKKGDMRIVLDGLAEDIVRVRDQYSIVPDLVMFSGDLVLAGEDRESFKLAEKELFDRVMSAANLNDRRRFIVPGNHDIQRKLVRDNEYVENGLRGTLIDVDKLNRFIDTLSDKSPALERMTNFNQTMCIGKNPIRTTSFVSTFKVRVGSEIEVGIACFNTAWRATGEPDERDRRNILLGERNVDLAIQDLNGTDIRIAMFHHPFDWMSEFDESAVASRLFSNFDILLCGHIHRNSPEARQTPSGSAVISQAGCLYEHRRHFNGYQYVTFDIDARKATFDIRTWFDEPRRSFDAAGNVAERGRVEVQLPERAPATNSAKVEKVLREVRPIIRENAADQIRIATSSDFKLSAKEAFICPPLRLGTDRPEVDAADELLEVKEETDKDEKIVAAEDLLRSNDNFIIVGDRETGKSSLAHYMAVLAAEGACDAPRIPVVIDYRVLKSGLYGIRKEISAYLSTQRSTIDIEDWLRIGNFLILIDNFSGVDISRKNDLSGLIAKFNLNRWVLFSDTRFRGLDPKNKASDLLGNAKVVSILPLSRKAIRELASRWTITIGEEDQKIFSMVMRQLTESSLPRTGYIVTLLLWAAHQEKRFERLNEAVLLTYMVDHLLGKGDFTKALRREFDATAKEITLQSLAVFLRSHGDYAEKNDVTEFLINFFRKKALPHSAADVLNALIECGILHETEQRVCFKYRCFQEYFYANLLRSDAEMLALAISDFEYIKYSRELELLSGLRRQNSDLLRRLSEVIENSSPQELEQFNASDFEAITAKQSELGIPAKQIRDIRRKRLTTEQIDDLMDATDREVASSPSIEKGPRRTAVATTKSQENSKLQPGAYLSTVSLLGRVIKNSEFTDADEKIKALRLYMTCTMKTCVLYSNAFREVLSKYKDEIPDDENHLTEKELNAIRYLLDKVLFASTIEDAVRSVNTEKLSNVYKNIIEDKSISLFELIFVSHLYFDLGHKEWLGHWRRIIDGNRKRRFVLELLIDRIWRTIHARPVSEVERQSMEKVTDEIEGALGLSKVAKGLMLENLRSSAKETSKRLNG